MIQEIFYIADNPVNPPKNWKDLLVELNYGKDQFPEGNTTSISALEWVRENYDLLIKYISAGSSPGGSMGNGIFEAPPLRMDLFDGTTTKTVFQGYVDLTSGLIIKDRISITAKATSHATVDWVNEIARSFTFEYLFSLPKGSPGAIDSSMFRWMPYVNNSVPNYEQAAIITLMVYNISQALVKEIEEVVGIVADASSYFNSIAGIIKLIVKIIYLIVLVVTLIKLVEDMIKFIISPVKYHAGMYVRDLFQKACEYLNMAFDSDIWAQGSPWYNEFIIPPKLYNAVSPQDSQLLGFLIPDANEQLGYFKGTFGDLIDAMKIKCNAKIVVTVPSGNTNPLNMGKVTLIRKDKNAKPPQYQMPGAGQGGIYKPEYTYNTEELISNHLIEFKTDSTELNTLQNYAGTSFQTITQPKIYSYRPFVMMKNFVDVTIPFSRAFAKKELTTPENLMVDFLDVFDTVANVLVVACNVVIFVINAVIKIVKKIFSFFGIKLKIKPIPYLQKLDLAQAILNRIDMMVLSSDHFSIAKILILKEGSSAKYNKIDPSNSIYETAKAMWDYFYYINSFLPSQLNPAYSDRPCGNQYMIKDFEGVPFDWQDFLNVFQNNQIFDANGNIAILESLKFNPYKQIANMRVRFPQIYTLNLQETFLNPTGA